MKEKLIDLLEDMGVICDVPCEADEDGCGTYETMGADYIADQLIANGVIVPVQCGECAHSTNSRSVDCAYKCKCKRSPCYDRITYADFGCLYGERRTEHGKKHFI